MFRAKRLCMSCFSWNCAPRFDTCAVDPGREAAVADSISRCADPTHPCDPQLNLPKLFRLRLMILLRRFVRSNSSKAQKKIGLYRSLPECCKRFRLPAPSGRQS
jgi:hypothetical protein